MYVILMFSQQLRDNQSQGKKAYSLLQKRLKCLHRFGEIISCPYECLMIMSVIFLFFPTKNILNISAYEIMELYYRLYHLVLL